ncbi:putative transmembrane transcriptional regulator (Anti-sigma factor) [Planktothrix agardhii]|jgi:anti-sigma factor RsiW|uniref:Predicted transmembrane transcriptional regulator (Anti-sigma factor) n=1 Tax=Planktothrix agardhii TaxID=1160 RepID=A0A1J1JCY7_PLAAG|nr:anti-sigma factor [Planktothrix agardhii]MCF3574936.1 anti-sigma factor [Planktothrix agardhii 1812]MCF3581171.1 anti-sigma factor [Planktothrix agardhii 1811]MCF3627277.1 anti-sigma factor [Planktothrix agardhii 1801]CAD5945429.1 putative transmembrane transcriptional regulator (Anti-sigma factor) [Planktothrix agardhii]CAD5959088.1 putative transmembrane transcriptional regulator (Anti-sigma factor) [Planktothrix agardhii]
MKHNLEPEPQTYSTIGGYLSEEHSDLDPKIQLLSAYLDNEATVAERRQVQLWLDTDPKIKATFLQLLQLRSRLQNAPVPASGTSVQKLTARVFQSLNQRTRRMATWGGTAIAALLVMTFSSTISGNSGRFPMFAQSETLNNSEPLQIALNEPLIPIITPNAVSISVDQPIIPIPKAAVSRPIN